MMSAAWLRLLIVAAGGISTRSSRLVTRSRFLPRAHISLVGPAAVPPSPVRGIIETVTPSVALVLPRGVRNTTLQGTAFRVVLDDFVDDDASAATEECCWLITAAHVAAPGCTLSIQFPSQAAVPAKLVGRANEVDVALIRVESSDLAPENWPPPLRLSAALARVGESVIGLGYPGGVFGPAASLGIVCAHAPAFALNASAPVLVAPLPAVALDARDSIKPTYVVTDAALAGGMSGGPLIAANGAVLGINVLVRPELRALGNYALASVRAVEAVRLILAPRTAAADPLSAWQVLLYNDRMNTKARVSKVLEDAGLAKQDAERVMSEAHARGRAVVRDFLPPDASEQAAKFCATLRAADLLVEAERAPISAAPEPAAPVS